jgi:Resolvase, N terminal domain
VTKITPEHLTRGAYIYIRQSTADQLLHNHESRRRQYGLADRARQLGWQDVVVIDDDLGRSGSGVSRPGFERLLAAICEGRVGSVFAIEVSRLARNGRDWHTLIEFCGLVGTIIVDEDGVYDPRHPNARHEGHDERTGALDPSAALAGSAQTKGSSWRALPDGSDRLRESPSQPNRY